MHAARERLKQEGHEPRQLFQRGLIVAVLALSCGHGRGKGESTLIPAKELELGARKLENTEASVLAREGVVILQNGSVIAQAGTPVDAQGRWQLVIQMPSNAAPGGHVVQAGCGTPSGGIYKNYDPESVQVT